MDTSPKDVTLPDMSIRSSPEDISQCSSSHDPDKKPDINGFTPEPVEPNNNALRQSSAAFPKAFDAGLISPDRSPVEPVPPPPSSDTTEHSKTANNDLNGEVPDSDDVFLPRNDKSHAKTESDKPPDTAVANKKTEECPENDVPLIDLAFDEGNTSSRLDCNTSLDDKTRTRHESGFFDAESLPGSIDKANSMDRASPQPFEPVAKDGSSMRDSAYCDGESETQTDSNSDKKTGKPAQQRMPGCDMTRKGSTRQNRPSSQSDQRRTNNKDDVESRKHKVSKLNEKWLLKKIKVWKFLRFKFGQVKFRHNMQHVWLKFS